MGLLSLFKKKRLPEIGSSVDIQSLDASFNLLKNTTTEVSKAAIETAKILQDRLNYSESRFFQTIDSINDLVLVKDGDGRWKTLNTHGQRLFGFHRGEYIGKTDYELMGTYPNLRETLMNCVKTDASAWNSHVSTRAEAKLTHATKVQHFDLIKTPTYHKDGSRKELIIVGRDVTELKEKAKRERACFHALNSASDGIVIVDQNEKIVFCNDKFVSLFKLGKYQNVEMQNINDILPEFPNYKEMWSTVKNNKIFEMRCPLLDNNENSECVLRKKSCIKAKCPLNRLRLSVLPMMNGQPVPIYYIFTFKEEKN